MNHFWALQYISAISLFIYHEISEGAQIGFAPNVLDPQMKKIGIMQIKSSHCRSTEKGFTAGHVFAIPGFWTPEASEPGWLQQYGRNLWEFCWGKPEVQLAQGRADRNILKTSACTETHTTQVLAWVRQSPEVWLWKCCQHPARRNWKWKRDCCSDTVFRSTSLELTCKAII